MVRIAGNIGAQVAPYSSKTGNAVAALCAHASRT